MQDKSLDEAKRRRKEKLEAYKKEAMVELLKNGSEKHQIPVHLRAKFLANRRLQQEEQEKNQGKEEEQINVRDVERSLNLVREFMVHERRQYCVKYEEIVQYFRKNFKEPSRPKLNIEKKFDKWSSKWDLLTPKCTQKIKQSLANMVELMQDDQGPIFEIRTVYGQKYLKSLRPEYLKKFDQLKNLFAKSTGGVVDRKHKIFKNTYHIKGSSYATDQILMMTYILSSDSIRRPLFSKHPTDPEFEFEKRVVMRTTLRFLREKIITNFSFCFFVRSSFDVSRMRITSFTHHLFTPVS